MVGEGSQGYVFKIIDRVTGEMRALKKIKINPAFMEKDKALQWK
jgi:hypothetical protein